MKDVLIAAGLEVPYLLDPRPNSYIEELRDDYPDLDYSRAGHSLTVENAPSAASFKFAPLSQVDLSKIGATSIRSEFKGYGTRSLAFNARASQPASA